ncbi:MAG: DUF1080 domain-containing protein [Gemmataceae bacterium]|nr:DUF1080 domain-containing protein [Gemmataceae bacterium]
MVRRLFAAVLGATALGLAAAPCIAQKKDRVAVADPDKAKADPDFLIQGEYEGRVIGKADKIGAQVVAKGGGKFDLVVYPGGLPGAGWDGKTPPVRGVATRTGDERRLDPTTADGKGRLGIINEGTTGGMNFTYSHGKVDAALSKVERKGKTLGEKPPAGAVVLFGGEGDEKKWAGGKLVELPDGKFLNVGVKSKEKFGAFKAHIEFRTPWMPDSSGQGRGNSGVYLQDRYELQVLDSFGLSGENNECGGFYQAHKPSVNMCLPPLAWQTYDIEFTPAKFDEAGKKTADAKATVYHNGVKVHDGVTFKQPSGGGQKEEPTPGPFQFQNHGDPVVYRNVWVVETK